MPNRTKYCVHENNFLFPLHRGSILGSTIATLFPENVIGYHSNMCVISSPLAVIKGVVASFYPTYFVEKEYEDFFFPLAEKWQNLVLESGYFHLQATKPDTLGIFRAPNIYPSCLAFRFYF